jgi:hypothetical protein
MIQNLEALVRAGKFKEASEALRDIKFSQVSRQEALAYAGIAIRVGQLVIALKILNPIIRGKNLLKPATAPEEIQYANLLRRLGAIPEAQEILKNLNADNYPEVSLYLAFCHTSQWEYKEAIPHLRHYLKTATAENAGFTAYKGSVAKVNLLAALIHEESFDEARALSSELFEELNPENARLLLGSVHELTAQLEISCKQWDKASYHLNQSAGLLQHAEGSLEALLIEKWQAIADTLKLGKPTESLLAIKERAFSLKQWETVRDCEFYRAKVTKDFNSLVHLYFGTPFLSFKKRILKELHQQFEVPKEYLWEHDSTQKNFGIASESFNLTTAQSETVALPPGQALHRLFIILCQDFYRPVPLVTLYAKLFPGDYFNPVSSPNRVHQIIKRFRQWLAKNKLGFEVQELSGSFKLSIAPGSAVKIPREPLPLESKDLEIRRLQELITENEFTAREAAAALSASRSETQRVLKWAVEAQVISIEGATKNLRYKKAG